MPALPSSLDGSVQSNDLMKFCNLGKVDGMLHGLDCLTQTEQDRWCCQVFKVISHVYEVSKHTIES